jgi:aryl-alcohol dehydrogenase-like predicted oxidoreductase
VEKSGLLLPQISLGLWHNFGSVDNFENAQYIVKEAFDGITHFDLANNMDRSQAQQRQISVKFWRIIFRKPT